MNSQLHVPGFNGDYGGGPTLMPGVKYLNGKQAIFWIGHGAYVGANAPLACSDLSHIGTELLKRGVDAPHRKKLFKEIHEQIKTRGHAYVTTMTNVGRINPKTGRLMASECIEVRVDIDYKD